MRVIDFACRIPGVTVEELGPAIPAGRRRLPPPPAYGPENYARIFAQGAVPGRRQSNFADASLMPTDEFVGMLRRLGVQKGVIRAADNAETVGLVHRYPDVFIGLAEISAYDGMRGVRLLERLVRDQGIAVLGIDCLGDVLPASDRRYYPLYVKAIELDIPVRIYCSMNYATDRPYDIGHPRHLDQVAMDLPELKICAALSGWPWISDMVGLMRRHPNLYCDTAAHRPRHFATPGSGWEMLAGLSWTMFGVSYETLLGEYMALPLKDAVKEKWLYGNAARFLGLV
jgi:predicted TIM-barrel fold metal-dependent hydrolase